MPVSCVKFLSAICTGSMHCSSEMTKKVCTINKCLHPLLCFPGNIIQDNFLLYTSNTYVYRKIP